MKKAVVFLFVAGVLGMLGVKYFSKTRPVAVSSQVRSATQDPASTERKPQENQGTSRPAILYALDNEEPNDGVYLYLQGKFAAALKIFTRDGSNTQDPQKRARWQAYRAKCYEYLGQQAQARTLWQELLNQYPRSLYCGYAKLYLAQQAQKQGHLHTACQQYQDLIAQYPQCRAVAEAGLALGNFYYQKGQRYEEKTWWLYSLALRGRFPVKLKYRLRKILDKLVQRLVFSERKIKRAKFYTVKSGDNLIRIARQHHTDPGFIMRINGKTKPLIRVGEVLKIIPGKVWIEVIKSEYFLALYLEDGYYLKGYDVGLGKDDRTPEGEFVIATKLKNPTWFNHGEPIPAGDPRNVLGTRWLGFRNRPGLRGFGIHGTVEPHSIGKNMSNGCVRMLNHEVEDLFSLVPRGTIVKIRRS